MICLTSKLSLKKLLNNWSFFVYHIQSKEKFLFFLQKSFFRKRENGWLNKKEMKYEYERKKAHEAQKKHENFVRKFFRYFGRQIYGLHQAEDLASLITL